MNANFLHKSIIFVFVALYLMTSIISTLHVVDFFELSNYKGMAIFLAVAFEIGAAASLASLVILDRMNKFIVWVLFITLTLFQAMGNMYYAYVNVHDFLPWMELFGLVGEDVIVQKRIISAVSGAILPLIALGFIKSLVDYIRPAEIEEALEQSAHSTDQTVAIQKITKAAITDLDEPPKLNDEGPTGKIHYFPHRYEKEDRDDDVHIITDDDLNTLGVTKPSKVADIDNVVLGAEGPIHSNDEPSIENEDEVELIVDVAEPPETKDEAIDNLQDNKAAMEIPMESLDSHLSLTPKRPPTVPPA